MKRKAKLHPSRAATALAAVIAVAALATAGPAAAQFPTEWQEAIELYESNVDEWLDGPVQHIILDEEKEIWKELRDAAQRKAFIQWFWDRRDPDLRDDRNPFKENFYARVAEANQRFSGFPRGWKSDRGRVWTVLGKPDNIRQNVRNELLLWTYFTQSRDRAFANAYGEMQVAFIQTRPTEYEIYGGFAPGQYPFYLRQAFELTNRAAIVDPFLELDLGRRVTGP